ncbi:hypothetical protein H6B10_17685, partial [Gemmiger formicilis]|uniref:hypothetical protein n=1 Tax=Gemmiger formicilis TaxID=745368 RepID=UPI00195B63D9
AVPFMVTLMVSPPDGVSEEPESEEPESEPADSELPESDLNQGAEGGLPEQTVTVDQITATPVPTETPAPTEA